MAGRNRVVDRDTGWRALLERVGELADKPYAKVGILGDSSRGGLHLKGPDGKSAPLTVAEIASVMEYGTEDKIVPERPFLRITFDARRRELEDLARQFVGAILDGKMNVERALNLLGLKLATEMRKTITVGPEVPPPNAPSVRRRKEAAGAWNKRGKAQRAGQGVRTLVDTGRMLNAIAWALVQRGAQGEESYVPGSREVK